MKIYHPKGILVTLFFGLMLVACKGSGSGMMAGGGIGGTGIISVGSISAFGSIVVNGTEFDTSNAALVIDGEEIGIGDHTILNNLDIGRVVTVEGTGEVVGNSFEAVSVSYGDDVEGPVESIRDINPITKEIVVLGQTVILNVVTKFKETTFEAIDLGDVVAVSGMSDDLGIIWANFVEKTGDFAQGVSVEVKGIVENLDSIAQTFKINDITVDYSLADTGRLPSGVLNDGLFIEVEGSLDVIGGAILATDLALANDLSDGNSAEIEVMGFVTDLESISKFTVGNQPVQVDADTLFVDGEPEDVGLGAKLEAEGSLVDGIIFAWEIEFWDPEQIEVEGLVNEIVTVTEFTVGDQLVRTDAETVFEGGTPDDIRIGINLEIKGKPVDSVLSVLIADKVSFEEE